MELRAVRCRALRGVRTLPVVMANRRARSRITYDRRAPILLLSPHLDDSVLSCWSVLKHPHDVRVINVFARVPPPGLLTLWDRLCGADDSAAQMRKRTAEDLEALALAGKAPRNLPFFDSAYRRCGPPPSFVDLDTEVTRIEPSASAVYAPVAAEHVDHRLVRRYAALIRRNGVPLCLYADVPYVTRFGWPAWVTGHAADPHLDVDGYWEANPFIPGRSRARVVALDAAASAAKLQAMRTYRSQLPALDAGPHLAVSGSAVRGFEVFWEVDRLP
jgi:LmbE family N-acetylglucosaminyl deacetylase